MELYERDVSGGDERRIFKRWEGAVVDHKYTFNSIELRGLINIPMQPVRPIGGAPLNIVANEVRPRRAAAEQADANRVQQFANPLRANPKAVTSAVHTHRAPPPEQLWEIPEGDESRILEFCCP